MNNGKTETKSGETISLRLSEALTDVGCRELLGELATIFAEDAPRLLNELESAVSSNETQIAQRAAHSLKSMAAVFRAEPTTSLARKAELLSKMNGWEEMLTVTSLLRPSIQQTIEALRQEGLIS